MTFAIIDLIQSCTLYVLNFYLVNEKCPLDCIILFASLKDEDFNVKYLSTTYLMTHKLRDALDTLYDVYHTSE